MLGTKEQAIDFISARVNERTIDMEGLLNDLFDLCGSWAIDNPLVDDEEIQSAIEMNTWRVSVQEDLMDDDDPVVGMVSGVHWSVSTIANRNPIDSGFVPTKSDNWEELVIKDLRDSQWEASSIDVFSDIVVSDLS